ncbi:hypothetical protein [Nocardia sp. NPDC052566]|uniref:hypothetical protein n=1 Tax=Nocardia sp. NPDC052566 TaxID=3364330 RepID=UPI0037CAED42
MYKVFCSSVRMSVASIGTGQVVLASTSVVVFPDERPVRVVKGFGLGAYNATTRLMPGDTTRVVQDRLFHNFADQFESDGHRTGRYSVVWMDSDN